MKYKIIVCVGLLFLVVGCASTPTQGEGNTSKVNHEKILPYIKPSVALICTAVLNEAVDAADRINKAIIINSVAIAVEKLAGGTIPTPEEIENAVKAVTPTKQHWTNLAVSFKDVYATIYDEYINGDVELATRYIVEISSGAKEASASYLE